MRYPLLQILGYPFATNIANHKRSPSLWLSPPSSISCNSKPLQVVRSYAKLYLFEVSLPEERRRRRRSSRGVARRRWRLALATSDAAINGTSSRQERPSKEGRAASGATEASLGRVPVLTLVRHLPLIHADRLPAAVAILREGSVEAAEAVRPSLPHHVPLPAELETGCKFRRSPETLIKGFFPLQFKLSLSGASFLLKPGLEGFLTALSRPGQHG